jgi:hypothetical protein
LKWQIPTMWHRAFHGWGYADTWNLDAHLASVIYESLVYLKAHRYGTPIVLKNWKDPNGEEESEENEKMWKVIEDEMIYAFKLAKEIGMGEREFYLPGMDNKFRKELKPLTRDENRKMRKGMLLFVKYFFNLWD